VTDQEKKIRSLSNGIKDTKDSKEIDVLKNKVKVAEEKFSDLSAAEKTRSKRYKLLETENVKSKEQIKSLTEASEEMKNKLKENEASRKKLEADVKRLGGDLTKEKDHAKRVKTEIDSVKKEVAEGKLKADHDIRNLKDELFRAKEENMRLGAKIEGMSLMNSKGTVSMETAYHLSGSPYRPTYGHPSSNPPSLQLQRYSNRDDHTGYDDTTLVLPPPPPSRPPRLEVPLVPRSRRPCHQDYQSEANVIALQDHTGNYLDRNQGQGRGRGGPETGYRSAPVPPQGYRRENPAAQLSRQGGGRGIQGLVHGRGRGHVQRPRLDSERNYNFVAHESDPNDDYMEDDYPEEFHR
jgi:hypothetical protein